MIEVGKKLPGFSLPNQDGIMRTPQNYEGRWLVLYIYPKDDTPGCTIQGQSFTRTRDEFEKAGITVVGLSADDVASHKNFCNKFSLTVELLADPETTLLRALGVGQSEYNGVKYWDRTTFVVDPQGVLRRVYQNVKPQDHEQMLLNDINALQKATV